MGKNLLELMPTSQSENVATACLAYLLEKKDGIYDELRKKLGIKGAVDDIEYIGTEKRFNSGRRIDLIIQTKECIYGVEVKLGAFFSDDQLEDYADQLKKLGDEKKHGFKLIALVPSWLENHDGLKKQAKKQANLKVVTWEELRGALNIKDEVSKNLFGFIEPRIASFGILDSKLADLGKISEGQKQFLFNFYLRYFYNSDINITGWGHGNEYYGGYIKNEEERIGYLSLQILKQNDGEKIIGMVVLSREPLKFNDDAGAYKKINLKDKRYVSKRYVSWVANEGSQLGDNYNAYEIEDSKISSWEEVGDYLSQCFRKFGSIDNKK